MFYQLTIILFKYKGSDYSSENAATIRANYPIPSQCKLFYFEIEIIDEGKNGYIGFIYFFFVFYRINILISAHNFFGSIFQKKNWCQILYKNS